MISTKCKCRCEAFPHKVKFHGTLDIYCQMQALFWDLQWDVFGTILVVWSCVFKWLQRACYKGWVKVYCSDLSTQHITEGRTQTCFLWKMEGGGDPSGKQTACQLKCHIYLSSDQVESNWNVSPCDAMEIIKTLDGAKKVFFDGKILQISRTIFSLTAPSEHIVYELAIL